MGEPSDSKTAEDKDLGHFQAVSWGQFENAEPEFAARIRHLFERHKHHTMATLRRDGSPRISGTEVDFARGQVILGVMRGARRTDDLRRDPRVALHSHSEDPPVDDPSAWAGDAKLSGLAIELPSRADGSVAFRIAMNEVVLTRVGSPADHLVIQVWRPQGRLTHRERH
jgi:Pyridoxamine 5'-phosphate oxidase